MFEIKITEIENTQNTNTGFFQQTPFWGEFKANHGWKNLRFALDIKYPCDDDELCENGKKNPLIETMNNCEVSVLTRTFAHSLFTIAYIPLFPQLPYKCTSEETLDMIFNEDNSDSSDSSNEIVVRENLVTAETQTIELVHLMKDLSAALKPFLPKNTICIRFDPAVDFSAPEYRDDYIQGMKFVSFADRLHLKKNKVDIQPPDSTQINLIPAEEEILNNMKGKWRYNIRLAEKKGVIIEKINGCDEKLSEKLDIFYDLYKITAERDGIGIHPKSYYEDLLKLSSSKISSGEDVPDINLYIAKHEEDNLGAIITLFSKSEAIYLYGCSSNVKRNLMPNFLLQWTAMKDAKAYGSAYYDMYGMPPTDDENHPMHGLYLFKTGFGGKNIHRVGSWDVPMNLFYYCYNSAEKCRAFWHKKVMKKIRGR